MPTATITRPPVALARAPAHAHELPRRHWEWLACGLLLAFALPYLLTDLVTTNRDVYYGIYSFAVFGFFALWLRYAVDQPRGS